MITIILPVSRLDYLEKVITRLELQECNQDDVNILCIVDGDDALYLRARNLVNGMKYINRLTVKADVEGYPSRLDVPTRRRRIAAIHNQARGLLTHSDGFVFLVEDDTTFGRMTLKRLLDVALSNRAFGFVEGVEVGRWGTPYIGAWRADDVYDPKVLTSIENINPVPAGQKATNIDAGGMYCALVRTDLYKQHEFNSDNGLGPDVNFGIEMRQLGYENFIAWNVPCNHYNNVMGKEIILRPTDETTTVTLTKQNATKWLVTT